MDSAASPSRRSQDPDDGALSARLAAIEEHLDEIIKRLDELNANLLTLLNRMQPG